jgi:phytoene dehydrogenase-like protein
MGGLGALRDALVRAARSVGVALHTGAEVTSIRTVAGRVSGVEVAGHGTVAADVVIANADAEHLYRDLLIDRRALRRVRRVKRSTSGFVICAAVTGRTAGLAHHNVWFSSDYRREFDDLDAGRFPADPTVYACVSSVTDPGQAPDGEENWFLLVNTPPGCQIDATTATTAVFAALEARQPGLDLADRARIITTLAPADLQRRYRAPGGAIYGTSSDGRRAAFARPGNISPVAGLYLVGGSSHPGGGLPLVTISARIVADALADALAEVSR